MLILFQTLHPDYDNCTSTVPEGHCICGKTYDNFAASKFRGRIFRDKCQPFVRRGRKAAEAERVEAWPSCRRMKVQEARFFCLDWLQRRQDHYPGSASE